MDLEQPASTEPPSEPQPVAAEQIVEQTAEQTVETDSMVETQEIQPLETAQTVEATDNTASAPQNNTVKETTAENDDFDDFGDFEDQEFGDFEEQEFTPITPVTFTEPKFDFDTDADMELYLVALLKSIQVEVSFGYYNTLLEKLRVIPLQKIQSQHVSPFLIQKDLVEPQLTVGKDIYTKMMSESIYTDENQFRWRRSGIRRHFVEATQPNEPKSPVKTPIEKQEEPVQEKEPTPQTQEPQGDVDQYELDLIEAKRLVDMTEDEIKKKSSKELEQLVKHLKSVHQKIQDQTNHWLDAKEQLVMDAEMHNKMIASLVQYAQQQQEQPKAKPKKPLLGRK